MITSVFAMPESNKWNKDETHTVHIASAAVALRLQQRRAGAGSRPRSLRLLRAGRKAIAGKSLSIIHITMRFGRVAAATRPHFIRRSLG